VAEENEPGATLEAEITDEGFTNEYVAALDRLAAELCVPRETLHGRITAQIQSSHPTPECLTIGELECWSLDSFPASRRAHVSSCRFCGELVRVSLVPALDQERRFVGHAVAGAQAASPGSLQRCLTGVGLVLTGVGLLSAFQLHRSRQTTEKKTAD
jgi:hypothetical protein